MTSKVLLLSLPAIVALSFGACAGGKKTDAAAPAPSAAPPAASEPAEKEPDKSSESEPKSEKESAPLTGCDAHMAEFDKVLAAASYSCKKDGDCQCFAGGISRARGGAECGGIVDAETGKKLATIEKLAKKDHCSNGAQCEPWTCDPICESERCQKGPRKKKK